MKFCMNCGGTGSIEVPDPNCEGRGWFEEDKTGLVKTIDGWFEQVQKEYGVTRAEIMGTSRTTMIAHARQHMMWILKRKTDLPLKAIGLAVGNRDHSTVIHGVAAHERRMANAAA